MCVLQIHVKIAVIFLAKWLYFVLGLNGGQCVPNGAGFLCNCPATFTGKRCEAPGELFSFFSKDLFSTSFLAATPCQPNPCQNGGTCTPQGNTFFCQCPSTYAGRCCEIRITTTTPYDPCRQSPCQNGGTCIPTGICVFLSFFVLLIKYTFFS